MVDISPQHFRKRVLRRGNRATLETRLWLTALLVLVALILANSWNRVQILTLQYQMEGLERDNEGLERDCSALKAHYESEKSPAKIANLSQRMGLVSATDSDVTIIQGQAFVRVDRNLLAENRPSASIHE